MEAFLLGLSSGTICLAHCAPVIVPYFMGEGNNTRCNAVSLAEFLSGRLAGYLLFGFVAWFAGRLFFGASQYRELFFGIIYVVLSLSMAYYGLFISKERCMVKTLNGTVNRLVIRKRWLIAATLGFLTGINFCPPFLLVFSSSAYADNLPQSVLFFFMFFLGTSLYFIPMVFMGFLKPFDKLKNIGKMTAAVLSVYFFYKGSIMIAGGIIAL